MRKAKLSSSPNTWSWGGHGKQARSGEFCSRTFILTQFKVCTTLQQHGCSSHAGRWRRENLHPSHTCFQTWGQVQRGSRGHADTQRQPREKGAG